MTRLEGLKSRLSKGRADCGLWSSTNSPTVAEILSDAGADWLLFDMEHSATDLASIVSLLQASKGTTTPIIVRPPSDDTVMIKRLLDAGADSLLVPMINDADQAGRVVGATRYPPHGNRGVAGSNRGARYGVDQSYLSEANDRICIIVQVETTQAVTNAFEIASVDGVDGVFIGPADLAADLGHLGNTRHADVDEAMQRAFDAVRRAGKPVGTFASSAFDAREKLSRGYSFVAVITDVRLLVQGAAQALAEARGRG